MSKVGGLGKGLDALFGEASSFSALKDAPANGGGDGAVGGGQLSAPPNGGNGADVLIFIDPRLLDPNPFQPRRNFDEEALAELRDSIKEHGVLQPIIAEKADDGRYSIVAGERRTRAAIMAGLEQVPVVVRSAQAGEGTAAQSSSSPAAQDGGENRSPSESEGSEGRSDRRRLEMALIENIQRTDLNPIEEASAYERLMTMGGLNQETLAQRVGKKRSTVANALRLLTLSEEIKTALTQGTITAGHARALLSVSDEGERTLLFKRIVDESLSVRETERAAKGGLDTISAQDNSANGQPQSLGGGAQPVGKVRRDPDIVAIEEQMIGHLGTKSRINGTLEKGRVEIDYYSRADLDRLCALLTGGME